MRVVISVAALLVNVAASTRSARTAAESIRWATVAVRVLVLPVPAPAMTRMGPILTAAAFCRGVSPSKRSLMLGGLLKARRGSNLGRACCRPGFPGREAGCCRKRVLFARVEQDLEVVAHCLARPAHDVERLARGG